MSLVLVAHASKRGSTAEVAELVAASLYEQGIEVDVRPVGDVVDPAHYSGVVLGAALYTGRLHRDARRFLRRHREALAALPVAVFAMGPTSHEAKDLASSRVQLDKALKRVPEVAPFSVAVFGGVVDPSTFGFPLNRMPAADARDWDAIHAWAHEVALGFGVADGRAQLAVSALA